MLRTLRWRTQAVSRKSLTTATRPLLYPRTRFGRAQPAATDSNEVQLETQEDLADEVQSKPSETTTTVPWYVEYNREALQDKYAPVRRQAAALPRLPDGPPGSLLPIMQYLAEDVGMTDLALIDLRRDEDDPWGYGPVICVLATAPRAERQLRRVVDATKHFLRSQMSLNPRVEGLDSLYDTKVKRRRRKKMQGRTNLQRFEAEEVLKWVFIDCGSSARSVQDDVHDAGEQTRILLQLFTPDGRQEYDLEDIYSGRADVYLADQSSPLARANDAARISMY